MVYIYKLIFILLICSTLASCTQLYKPKPVPFGTKEIVITYEPILPEVSVSEYALSECIIPEEILPNKRPPTIAEFRSTLTLLKDSLKACASRHKTLTEEFKTVLGKIRNVK